MATLRRTTGEVRLADPAFELRWSDTGYPVDPNPTFYHKVNAESQANYLQRTQQRNVDIWPFSGWDKLQADWQASK